MVEQSKFYVNLSDLEKQIREISSIGVYLKLTDPGLLKKLDDAADGINEFFKKNAE